MPETRPIDPPPSLLMRARRAETQATEHQDVAEAEAIRRTLRDIRDIIDALLAEGRR